MTILTVNTGSSSLKFTLYSCSEGHYVREVWGEIHGFGPQAAVTVRDVSGWRTDTAADAQTHGDAFRVVVPLLRGWAASHSKTFSVDAVAFRIVHGGERFVEPVILTPETVAELENLTEPAPLHNPPALSSIMAAREIMDPQTRLVGVFDTQFHRHMPPVASTYALPPEFARKYNIRRFGFHGLAHEYMMLRYGEMAGTDPAARKIITLQLGSGASACAIDHGQSIDTSMGYTPMEGLVMRTRSGDIDPGIVSYLVRRGHYDADKLDDLLNRHSGLAGLAGDGGDMEAILARTDEAARLAVDVFCYRVRKFIGAYTAVLGGLDAIVFGGGIGGNAPGVREMILAPLEFMGVAIDRDKNYGTVGEDGRITGDASRIQAYAVDVDESHLLVRYAYGLLGAGSQSQTVQ